MPSNLIVAEGTPNFGVALFIGLVFVIAYVAYTLIKER